MVSALDVQAATVAVLNDRFRRSGFGVTMTLGIQAMSDVSGLMDRVRDYKMFNESNDPYGEHDFGKLIWENEKVFWKIDYYDQNLEYGEEPLALGCKRLLTVMLANEY